MLAVLTWGCPREPQLPDTPAPASQPASRPAHEDALSDVARIHGGTGPWVVAGHRMGTYALRQLNLGRYSHELEVVHHSPRQVQYSCIADGAAAATGASAGKLNLVLLESAPSETATTYRNRTTGKALTLRPTAAFEARFKDLPREQLAEAGQRVMTLPDRDIFEEVPVATP
ncbi:MAG: FmdE family protein [Myxococcota bacterium]